MGSLVPGQKIIYERLGNTVYARYRDPPYNKRPRWVVGYHNPINNEYNGEPLTESMNAELEEWLDIKETAKKNKTLQKQLDKMLEIYYIVKTDNGDDNERSV